MNRFVFVRRAACAIAALFIPTPAKSAPIAAEVADDRTASLAFKPLATSIGPDGRRVIHQFELLYVSIGDHLLVSRRPIRD